MLCLLLCVCSLVGGCGVVVMGVGWGGGGGGV